MDIHGSEFAAFLQLELSPGGLSAVRDVVMPTIKDSRMQLIVDWLLASMEGTTTESQPEAPLTPADVEYRDALLSMISERRGTPQPNPSPRLHTLPAHLDFLSFTRAERVWSPIKLLNFFYRSHFEPKRGAAVVTSVRNEGINLVEWIAHHKLLGFDEFFFYINDSDDGTTELLNTLAEHDVCHVIRNETHLGENGQSAFSVQAKAFEHAIHFLTPLRNYKWVLFSDVDEFLVIKPLLEDPSWVRPLDELIHRLDGDPAHPCGVLFNWKWFGSNSAYLREDGLAFERFQNFRGSDHIKTFARLNRCLRFSSSHLPHFAAQSRLFDGSLTPIAEPRIQLPAAYEYGQMNHYWNKSFEEFVAKRLRGRGFRSFDDFFAYGNNRSFGRFEALPVTWVARVKAEFKALLSLSGVEDRHREADARFRSLVRGQETEHGLLDLYIEGRFNENLPYQTEANQNELPLSNVITSTFGDVEAVRRLPLLEGTGRFAAPWIAHWHGQSPILPMDPLSCHMIKDAIVTGAGTIWTNGLPFRRNHALTQDNSLPIREVPFPCLVIEGRGAGNYGRDLLDLVLRGWISRLAANKKNLSLKVLVESSAPQWLAPFLKAAGGFSMEDIEYYDPTSERVLIRQAIIPSSPLGPAGYYPIVNQIVERILKLGQKAPDASPKRIFLTQGAAQGPGARQCLNEAELVDIATGRYGFTPVAIETLGWHRQLDLFREANVILINSSRPISSVIFCPPNTRVASIGFRELLPSQLGTLRGHRNAYFMSGTESSSQYLVEPSGFGEFLDAVFD